MRQNEIVFRQIARLARPMIAEAEDSARSLRFEHPHRDPITGNCADCGATREQIDDNLFACEKITGPNRVALLGLKAQLRSMSRLIDDAERDLRFGEERIVQIARSIREQKAHREELEASIRKLQEAE